MTASPTPISTWTPTIAPKTVSKATGAVAPNSHCSEKAMADNTTETPAANAPAPTTPPTLRGRRRRNPRNSAQPAKAGTTAMLTVL